VKGKIPNKGRAQSERCTTAKDAAVPKNFLKVHPKNKSQFSPETEIAMMIAQNILQFNKPISAEKFQCKKNRRENFSGKKLSRKFLREKNCSEISAEKFGCENSAEKKCRGISAKKIWLQNFRGKNCSEISARKIVIEFQRKKIWSRKFLRENFGCENSAKKKSSRNFSVKKNRCKISAKKNRRGISAQKIWLRKFLHENFGCGISV
jgi:hypothetical protein